MSALFNGARLYVTNTDGSPLVGGLVYTYAAGTTTPKATYSDAALTTPKANPFTLDAYGQSDVWLDGAYKILIKTSAGATLPGYPVDNITSLADFSGSTGASLIGWGSTTVADALTDLYVRDAVQTNLLANGNMTSARTTASTALLTTATIQTVDGWYLYQNTTSAGTSSRTASGFADYPYALKIGRNAASTSTDSIIMIQALRSSDSVYHAGKNVTFSFYAKAGANFSAASSQLNVALFCGTGTDQFAGDISGWTGVSTPVAANQVITNSFAQYTFTAAIPSNCTQIGVRLFYTPSGTAGADDNLYVTGVELVSALSTPQTRLEALDLFLARPITPACGRLSNLITNTGPVPGADPFDSCHFIPYNGNLIAINGKLETIPDGQLAASGGLILRYANCYIDKVAGQTAADNTFYWLYVFMNAGVPTLMLGTTGYSQNGARFGNAVKTDDPLCTLVGICYIQHVGGIPTTLGGARGQTISSYFNQFRANLITAVAGPVTNTSATALPGGATLANGQPTYNYLEWVQWYDNAPRTRLIANVGVNSAGATANLGIGTNSSTVITGTTGKCVVPTTADNTQNIGAWSPPTDATGYYYAQVLGYSSAGTLQADGYFEAQGVMV